MPARITRLATKADKLEQSQAQRLRESLRTLEAQLELPYPAMRELFATVERQTRKQSRWSFIMINTERQDEIIGYLLDNSRYPMLSVRLWSKCLMNVRDDTGEVLRSRQELAEDLKTNVENITRIMTELEKFDAVIKHRQKIPGLPGRGVVRYFLNPTVATHLPGAARDAAQKAAPSVGKKFRAVECKSTPVR